VLGKLKSAALADVFETLLADKSPFVRQNAAWALGELAADADGRTAARRAVAELRHARAKDPAPDVRTAASGALARLE
jgi:HEAT repeat protein